MRWGSYDDERRPTRERGDEAQQDDDGWKWSRPWGGSSWDRPLRDDDDVNFSTGRTMRWGNSKMDWGNRWRPNFGNRWAPGHMPSWNMYPGWEQYQYGPRGESPYRGRGADDRRGPPAQQPPSQPPAQPEPGPNAGN